LAWTIEYKSGVQTQLKRLDKSVARRIVDLLEKRLALRDNPRTLGAALTGSDLDDYRIIADIQDKKLTILAVRIGNRRDVYQHHK